MPRGASRLLTMVGPLARLVTRAYYQVTVAGPPGPGPLLLIANHPNEAFDPLLVAAGVHRPVRFLAKVQPSAVPGVAAIVREAGCRPVYRRSDDPSQTGRNEATFAAVFEALYRGVAVAIFPEGTDVLTRARAVAQESRASRHLYAGSALVLAGLVGLAWSLRGPLAALLVGTLLLPLAVALDALLSRPPVLQPSP